MLQSMGHKELDTTERLNWTDWSARQCCWLPASSHSSIFLCFPKPPNAPSQGMSPDWSKPTLASCFPLRMIDLEVWACDLMHRAKLLQSCTILCDPVDCSPPGSSVHGILQARILEWVAMPSSRGPSQPRNRIGVSYFYLHWQAGSLPLAPPGLM